MQLKWVVCNRSSLGPELGYKWEGEQRSQCVLCNAHVCRGLGGGGVLPGKHTWRTSTEAAQDCICWWGPFSYPLPMTYLCVTRICSHLSVCNSKTGESILSLTSREALGSALDIFSHCWTQWLARVSSREFSQFKMEHSVMKMLHSLRLW